MLKLSKRGLYSRIVIEKDGFRLDPKKFDYFFGRVTAKRSQQNLSDLRKLGIDESKGGREKLEKIFAEGLKAPTIGKKHSEGYGLTIFKEVEIVYEDTRGAIEIGYFYEGEVYEEEDLTSIPKITTIIPKIYR